MNVTIKMLNLYSTILESNLFNKIEVSELLFVEYTCMQEATKFGIWSDNNYFAFISSGKKIWKSIDHSYEVSEGDILFVKKGANLTHQFFDDKFCGIFLFIPDDFIKSILQKNPELLNTNQKDLSGQDSVLRVANDDLLDIYHHTIRSYMSLSEKPNEQLIKLKFEELILSLFAGKKHQPLTDYFISLCQSPEHQLKQVMEKNFAYNLQLAHYAKLCHMSLTTFKKTFKQLYGTTPAVWLKDRKIELARTQIAGGSESISQIAFECGFEDTSHFIRVFKQKYKLTPLQYRQQYARPAHMEMQPV